LLCFGVLSAACEREPARPVRSTPEPALERSAAATAPPSASAAVTASSAVPPKASASAQPPPIKVTAAVRPGPSTRGTAPRPSRSTRSRGARCARSCERARVHSAPLRLADRPIIEACERPLSCCSLCSWVVATQVARPAAPMVALPLTAELLRVAVRGVALRAAAGLGASAPGPRAALHPARRPLSRRLRASRV